ncbi:IS110 family transposase [Nonomuraea endophytica]|uniref:IS110 family transposase n=1 Tax=Nonomuraea endophytica TaxID=714136 RepID=UPI001C864E41
MQYAPTTSLPACAPNDVTAGLDWASADHAVCVVDTAGTVTTRFTLNHTDAGLKDLTHRLSKAGAAEVAIERGDGPVVEALLAAGLTVVVISPTRSRTCAAGTAPSATKTTGSTRTCWPIPCVPIVPGFVPWRPTARPQPPCGPPSVPDATWSPTASHCATNCARTWPRPSPAPSACSPISTARSAWPSWPASTAKTAPTG